jgi:hypothetical protein
MTYADAAEVLEGWAERKKLKEFRWRFSYQRHPNDPEGETIDAAFFDRESDVALHVPPPLNVRTLEERDVENWANVALRTAAAKRRGSPAEGPYS